MSFEARPPWPSFFQKIVPILGSSQRESRRVTAALLRNSEVFFPWMTSNFTRFLSFESVFKRSLERLAYRYSHLPSGSLSDRIAEDSRQLSCADYSRRYESTHACLFIRARAWETRTRGYRTKKYAFVATTFHKLLINAFPGSMSWSASQERPFPEVASAPRTSNHEADT